MKKTDILNYEYYPEIIVQQQSKFFELPEKEERFIFCTKNLSKSVKYATRTHISIEQYPHPCDLSRIGTFLKTILSLLHIIESGDAFNFSLPEE